MHPRNPRATSSPLGRGGHGGDHVAPPGSAPTPGRAPPRPAKLGGVCPAIGYVGFPDCRARPYAARSVGGGLSPGPRSGPPGSGEAGSTPSLSDPCLGAVSPPLPRSELGFCRCEVGPQASPSSPGSWQLGGSGGRRGLKLLHRLWGAGKQEGYRCMGAPRRPAAPSRPADSHAGSPALQGKGRARPKGAPQARAFGSRERRPQRRFAGAGGEVGAGWPGAVWSSSKCSGPLQSRTERETTKSHR